MWGCRRHTLISQPQYFSVSGVLHPVRASYSPNIKRHIYEIFNSIFSNNTHISVYVCMHIYIYAVKLLSGPSLGVFGSYYLVQVGFLEVIIWSKFVFLAYKNSGFKRFVLHTQLSFCVFFCPQFSGNFLKIAFFKKGCKNWVFQFSVF